MAFIFTRVLIKKSLRALSVLQRSGYCIRASVERIPSEQIHGSKPEITPVFQIATNHLNKIALKDKNGSHSYSDILRKSLLLAKKIQAKIGRKQQERIVFLCPNDVSYIIAQWACWAAGHIGKYAFF